MRITTLDRCDENVLVPAHSAPDCELIFYERIVEHFPSSTVDTIVSKASLPSNRNVAAVVGYDSASDRPLVYKVV